MGGTKAAEIKVAEIRAIEMKVDGIKTAVVVGGGPAGLMAAEQLAQAGVEVDVYDAMPSVGRKFLLAGKGGMNLTHAEDLTAFLSRYGHRQAEMARLIHAFTPQDLRAFVHGLGIDTFVGSSQRVFPTDMKAAPLLRAWLQRLRARGVRFHMRQRWLGWDDASPQALRFNGPQGVTSVQAQALVLALGGGSWARLGSDGAWVDLLRQHGVPVAPLRPANCGFEVAWSDYFRAHYAGQPLLTVALGWQPVGEPVGKPVGKPMQWRKGQFVLTEYGVEGSLIYALSSRLREQQAALGQALVYIDLLPDWPAAKVLAAVSHPRGSRSLASHLQSRLGLKGVQTGLLRELLTPEQLNAPAQLAAAIKALPLTLLAPRPLDEAISSAGGVCFSALDENLMLRTMPGVFCSGEMLDWEAPTGGYLLTGCFASGRAAGQGALAWLADQGEKSG